MDDWSDGRYFVEWAKALAAPLTALFVLWFVQWPVSDNAIIIQNEESDRELVRLVLDLRGVEEAETRVFLSEAALAALPAEGSLDIRKALETLIIQAKTELVAAGDGAIETALNGVEETCRAILARIETSMAEVESVEARVDQLENAELPQQPVEGEKIQNSLGSARNRLQSARRRLAAQRAELSRICSTG
ncbi:MAG: hypothetical protein AAGF78_00975 [Pseudomonadota bacterium]